MDGNKILNGILADLKGIIPKLMKPYMKRGKVQWAKFLIEVVPLFLLFVGSTYVLCAFAYKRFAFTALLWSAFITFFGWMVLDDKKKNRKQFRGVQTRILSLLWITYHGLIFRLRQPRDFG